jgi:hypothetical protein
MTEAELIIRVTQELKALSANFVAIDYTNAVLSACAELGFVVPNTNTGQIYWLVQRTKRHLIYALWIAYAPKFKLKQLSLDQKFTHLGELIKTMDAAYEKALDTLVFDSSVPAWSLFGTKIDAGFLNDPVTGEDLTYTEDNYFYVIPTGNENA